MSDLEPGEPEPEPDLGESGTTPASASRRRRRWPWVIGVLGFLGVWALLSMWMLTDAKRHAERGIDELRGAQADLTAADLLRGEGRERFVAAQRQFQRAHDKASSPVLGPLKFIPFVGRQVHAVERMTGAANETLDIGIRALDASGDAIDATEPRGSGRVTLARRLGAIASDASNDLDAIDLGPDQHLFGSLQRARDRFGEEFADLSEAMSDLEAAGNGLGEFLEGPSRYLVLAANNSEMRMGSGAFLSAGVLTVDNGSFDLGPMEATEDLRVPAGAVPIIDEDFATQWAFAEPTEDFRELATTSRFDVLGPMALAMWEQAKGERLDGVLVIDPIALKSLLRLTGPVVVEGKEYSTDNVVREIFLEQYRGLEDQGQPAQIARRDRLSRIARAAIDALEAGGWDTVDLVDALRPAVGGRHVLAFADGEVQQRGWVGAGISGETERDSLTVGLQNRAGNKLDQFIVIDAVLTRHDKAGDNQELAIEMTLTNLAPEDLPRYVEGPYPTTPRAEAGKYQGWITIELPAFAQDNYIEVDGVEVPHVATGRDGPNHRVVAALVEFERGSTKRVIVHFEVGDVDESLYINPGARVPSIQWHSGESVFDDSSGHRVEFEDLKSSQ
jgi:hypothetical protein